MKNGSKYIALAASFLVINMYKKLSKNKLIEKENIPRLDQYLNRLTEFYSAEELDLAEDEFLTLVDFGLSPQRAFASLIEDGV